MTENRDYDPETEGLFMERAFVLAREALNCFEVPVGCVFVAPDRTIIGEGRNEVNATKNATRHAETVAIDRILSDIHEKYRDDPEKQEAKVAEIWKSLTLFVTVEPCIMCASAIEQLGIRRVVFGCRNQKFGGCGSIYDIPKIFRDGRIPLKIIEGVRKEEAVKLLQEFYNTENPFVPPELKKPRGPKSNRCTNSSVHAL